MPFGTLFVYISDMRQENITIYDKYVYSPENEIWRDHLLPVDQFIYLTLFDKLIFSICSIGQREESND